MGPIRILVASFFLIAGVWLLADGVTTEGLASHLKETRHVPGGLHRAQSGWSHILWGAFLLLLFVLTLAIPKEDRASAEPDPEATGTPEPWPVPPTQETFPDSEATDTDASSPTE